ncbi:hypothetical protein Pflav_008450 [Phytohabitans flavus]|uniref:Uncharacterized protein n=1 Tax=Phytohabitans flavus TaxID=1076124 RepID=A0A6F8XKU4_9ACTN|nr:hypothetical protein Pflav_008450 [Phytohabitans flavus]
MAGVEAADAEGAEEDAEEAGDQLGLVRVHDARLAVLPGLAVLAGGLTVLRRLLAVLGLLGYCGWYGGVVMRQDPSDRSGLCRDQGPLCETVGWELCPIG